MGPLVRKSHRIQDYTTINNVGSVAQQMAGHKPLLVEPGTLSSEVLALYYFGADGDAITQDEKGSYTLTNVNTVTQTGGIFGGSIGAASLNGTTQYFSQATLLDTTPAAIVIDCWIKPTDGQPAANNYICRKDNVSAQDVLLLFLMSDGKIRFFTEESNNGPKAFNSSTTLPNGATDWYYVCASWDTTHGKRLWINGILEAQDPSATTLMGNGTATDFLISNSAEFFGGNIAYFRVRNKVLTQKDVDVAYASTYSWAQSLDMPLSDIQLVPYTKEVGHDDFISQYRGDLEVARYNNTIYRYGDIFESTDKLKIVGGML